MSEQLHHLQVGENHYVSLDGDRYLGISRAPIPGEGDEIEALIEGRGRNSRPMLIARAALVHYAERGDKITEQRVER